MDIRYEHRGGPLARQPATRRVVPLGARILLTLLVMAVMGTAGQAFAIPPAGPTLHLTRASGMPGMAVTASGTLTSPSPVQVWSEQVGLYFGNRLVASGTTSGRGTFSILFTVPNAPSGRYLVTALGRSSHGTASGLFVIPLGVVQNAQSQGAREIPPVIRLDVRPNRGPGGTAVQIRARGLGCPIVTLWFTDSRGTRTELGPLPLKGSSFQTSVVIPRNAAPGFGAVSALGTSPYMCSAAGTFWVCTECLGQGQAGIEAKLGR